MATWRSEAPSAKPLLASEQDAVIQERLAVPERPLKVLMSKLTTIAKSKKGEEMSRAVISFTLELESYLLNLERIQAVANKTTPEEIRHYEEQVALIEREKEATELAIAALKQELVEVRQERQNKLEYDELAKQIAKYGTREELENSLTSLREAIASLETESQKYTEVMNTSEVRFEGIASQLEALRAEVGHEVGEREKRAVERGAGEEDGAADEEAAETDGRLGTGSGGGGGVGQEGDVEDDRESSRPRPLNPSAPSFRPLRNGGLVSSTGDRQASRASTPGAASVPGRSSKRTRSKVDEDDEGDRSSRRRSERKPLRYKLEEGEMSDRGEEDDEEEEGAA